MKAGIVITGTGPILILTSYQSFSDPTFSQKLSDKGIKKYIAYELPVEKVQDRYGLQFSAIARDLSKASDLRVLDYNGHQIFSLFRFDELGQPIYRD
ncbi:MAG: hypothetical protein ACLGPL_04115 [Acidobacteriota bacterium]